MAASAPVSSPLSAIFDRTETQTPPLCLALNRLYNALSDKLFTSSHAGRGHGRLMIDAQQVSRIRPALLWRTDTSKHLASRESIGKGGRKVNAVNYLVPNTTHPTEQRLYNKGCCCLFWTSCPGVSPIFLHPLGTEAIGSCVNRGHVPLPLSPIAVVVLLP
ncbi:hypothetical protein J6590_006270 [Homalodisca vitripennis]|nr:hypothetical protein J6590_006270 [Homalodisca vitripennis]